MSPLVKGLLATALTLPLVAFVAGVLASPDPVNPDRSRPVIIGNVNEDVPTENPSKAPPTREAGRPNGGAGPDDRDDRDDRGDDGPDGGVNEDPPYTVVTPPPRDLDADDDDDDDDGDDDDDDDSDGGRESGDD